MILIDALYINGGGGKTLLDYLVRTLVKLNIDAYYIFDSRIKDEYSNISLDRKSFIKASFYCRFKFYKKLDKKVRLILCLGNVPPIQKHKFSYVITYFHQTNFIISPSHTPIFIKLKFAFKSLVLKFLRRNTDEWLVQSLFIKQKFMVKYCEPAERVEVLPFFPETFSCSHDQGMEREKGTFIYVSNASAHKNHFRLIQAFCSFYDKFKFGKLILTVQPKYLEVYNFISKKIREGYPIINLGFIDRDELWKYYSRAEYLVFPSLNESFGLGLVEAMECGCKVIGADLPYTYEVCDPSLTFDPLSTASIEKSLANTLKMDVEESSQKIYNEIDELTKKLMFYEL